MEIAVYPGGAPSVRCGRAEITVFGKHAGRIHYGEDRENRSSALYSVCAASRASQGVAVAFADTTAGGAVHRSALVADRGKLLGITDELGVENGDYIPGKTLRVYETSAGKIGVFVGADLYRFEPAHALSACGAELLIHVEKHRKKETNLLGGALAYLCGVPVLTLSGGVAALFAESGELCYASPVEGARVTCAPRAAAVPLTLLLKRRGREGR